MNSEQLEAALGDFRNWHAEWNELPEVDFPDPTVDFAALIAGFTALRHEVNLQTRAARTATEQSAEALKCLQERPASATSSNDTGKETARPFVKALIDVYDQLAMACHGVEKRRNLPESTPAPVPAATSPGLIARLFGASKPESPLVAPIRDDSIRATTEALLTGYRMSMARIDKLLDQQGLEVIPAAGLPFDPELMEAIEAEDCPGILPGTVAFEIRRGYRWHGQVFRCAQVKVAR